MEAVTSCRPCGWFTPFTPDTKVLYRTLGGARHDSNHVSYRRGGRGGSLEAPPSVGPGVSLHKRPPRVPRQPSTLPVQRWTEGRQEEAMTRWSRVTNQQKTAPAVIPEGTGSLKGLARLLLHPTPPSFPAVPWRGKARAIPNAMGNGSSNRQQQYAPKPANPKQ